jgi:hypothetical protein
MTCPSFPFPEEDYLAKGTTVVGAGRAGSVGGLVQRCSRMELLVDIKKIG